MGEFKLGRMTLKSLFSKPATKLYPVEPPQFFPTSKGHVVIDTDRCRFDGSCANLCPTGALEVDRKALTWSIDRFKCIQCRNCIEVCVEDALHMENTYATPSTEHVREVFEVTPVDRERREREAAEKAARAAKLREEALAKKKAAAAAEKAAKAGADGKGAKAGAGAEPTAGAEREKAAGAKPAAGDE